MKRGSRNYGICRWGGILPCLLAVYLLTGCAVRPAEQGGAKTDFRQGAAQPTVSQTAAESDAPGWQSMDSADEPAPCAWSERREAGALALIRTYGGDESLVKPETIEILGDIGAYTFCRFLLAGDCASITETYGGCTILSSCIGYPSATRLYLVGDARIYTLQQAYVQGIVTDMKAVYDRLPFDMPADYDPTAEDSYLDMDPMDCFTWE